MINAPSSFNILHKGCFYNTDNQTYFQQQVKGYFDLAENRFEKNISLNNS
jgi:hypothetical protein